MPLQPGSKLGPYEIEEPLGKGGMGEVWAALDPRVDRRVAIKVLPDDVARDRDRLARFEREAKALAALSHPNVATLFGLEEEGGQPFLVMELAPGETLGERIDRGPLRIEEALEVFEQLAEGLEAAHNSGLVHRDLKPANIKVDDEGRARILDFGLALALGDEPGASSADATRSPTLTAGTAAGVLLGTAAYMAPEQARGKRVDPRADIWAWGCCLWQALTGKRTFAGDDVAMTLAAVLSQEPDFDQLPSDLPSALRTLLERCLEKDPRQRLQHIGEARWWLGQARLGDASPSQSDARASAGAGRRLPLAALAVAAALVIGAGVGSWLTSRAPTAAGTAPISYRFEVDGAAKLSGWSNLFGNQLAVRPDGTAFAYESRDGIRLHDFSENRSYLVPGTEGSSDPVFSQDGERLAFWRDNILQSTGLAGGPVQERLRPKWPRLSARLE